MFLSARSSAETPAACSADPEAVTPEREPTAPLNGTAQREGGSADDRAQGRSLRDSPSTAERHGLSQSLTSAPRRSGVSVSRSATLVAPLLTRAGRHAKMTAVPPPVDSALLRGAPGGAEPRERLHRRGSERRDLDAAGPLDVGARDGVGGRRPARPHAGRASAGAGTPPGHGGRAGRPGACAGYQR